MATGDMTARLLLDGKEFEQSLKRAKKNTEDFGAKNAKVGKEVVAAFGKITAAIGALKGSKAAFDAVINSSQMMGDAFRAQMAGMEGALKNFIYALANADYGVLSDGIATAVKRGKQAATAEDQFANTRMAVQFASATKGSEYKEAMVGATNKALSVKERKKYLDIAKDLMNELVEGQETLQRDAIEAIRTAIASSASVDVKTVTKEAILKAAYLDQNESNIADRAVLKAKYDEYAAQVNKYVTATASARAAYLRAPAGSTLQMQWLKKWNYAQKAEEEAVPVLKKQYADIITQYTLLFRDTKEELQAVYDKLMAAISAKDKVSEMQKAINEAEAAINTDAKGSKKSSGAKVSKEIQEPPGGWKIEVSGARAMPQIANTFPGQIGMMSIGGESVSEDQRTFDWAIMKDAIKQAKGLEDVNTIVGELSGSFATLGSNIEGTAGSMFTFIGATLDAVQAIIPLIGYIQAEAAMRDKNATEAAKEAAAKTLSAYANIPFAGIALGVAGVAAIITAIQSIPKFAEGGIVNRATLGVFGEAGPEAVMPLDKLEEYITPREMRVTGNIKASGKDLVVVLDNYNRVRNG